jgi:hypothetical protein
MPKQDWDPAEVQRALDTELAAYGDERTMDDIARRKLNDAVPFAADALIHIVMHSENERHRLQASEYILNKVLGKPSDMPQGDPDKDDALTKLAGTVTVARSN